MKKYIIEKGFGGYVAKYPISNRLKYFRKGARLRVWKTLRGAENYIKKMPPIDGYIIAGDKK